MLPGSPAPGEVRSCDSLPRPDDLLRCRFLLRQEKLAVSDVVLYLGERAGHQFSPCPEELDARRSSHASSSHRLDSCSRTRGRKSARDTTFINLPPCLARVTSSSFHFAVALWRPLRPRVVPSWLTQRFAARPHERPSHWEASYGHLHRKKGRTAHVATLLNEPAPCRGAAGGATKAAASGGDGKRQRPSANPSSRDSNGTSSNNNDPEGTGAPQSSDTGRGWEHQTARHDEPTTRHNGRQQVSLSYGGAGCPPFSPALGGIRV